MLRNCMSNTNIAATLRQPHMAAPMAREFVLAHARAMEPLTPEDYARAAQACRVAAYQAKTDAEKQTNPGIVATFESERRKYEELSKKFEARAKSV